MRVFYMDSKESVSGYYRMILPGMGLRMNRLAEVAFNYELIRKYGDDLKGLGLAGLEELSKANIIHLQQTMITKGLWLFEAAKSHGIKIIIDTDDKADCGTPGDKKVPLRLDNWQARKIVWKVADAFTCTSQGMREWLRAEFGRPVYVLPNMLDCGSPRWQARMKKPPHKKVVGWSGGDTHYSDLEILRDVLPAIAARPDVKVLVQGMNPGFWDDNNRIHVEDFIVDFIKDYPRAISRFDIGLCPVMDHEFNTQGKSDLKFLDYTMIGAATIASNRRPYTDSMIHGKNGLLVGDDPQEWIDAINRLLDQPGLRRKLAWNADFYLKKHRDIRRTAKMWRDCYRAVMAQGPAPILVKG